MNRTIEQYRVAFALEFIRAEKSKQDRDKLLTHIRKTPIQILQNGLGQTLAFLLAENGDNLTDDKIKPSGRLYRKLQEWLCGAYESDKRPCRVYSEGHLIDQLISNDREHYMRAQREAIALLGWMKKFAEAWLAKEA